MATEKSANRVAGWLWWVLIGLSLVLMLFVWWGWRPKDRTAIASNQTAAGKIPTIITLEVPVGGLQDGEKVIYGPFAIPPGEWGQEIENPHLDGHQLIWTPIGLDKGDCQISMNGELDRVYPCNAFIDNGVRTFQFKSKSGKQFQIEIELQKKTN